MRCPRNRRRPDLRLHDPGPSCSDMAGFDTPGQADSLRLPTAVVNTTRRAGAGVPQGFRTPSRDLWSQPACLTPGSRGRRIGSAGHLLGHGSPPISLIHSGLRCGRDGHRPHGSSRLRPGSRSQPVLDKNRVTDRESFERRFPPFVSWRRPGAGRRSSGHVLQSSPTATTSWRPSAMRPCRLCR